MAALMILPRKKRLQVQDFSHGCLTHQLDLPRNAGFLLADQDQELPLSAQALKHTDQPPGPRQQRLSGSPEHKMWLTGTLGWLSVW
ncbi:Os09g0563275 [Oryza sativa Japonica Group]|uniref:Os09g0563275 protein n=1 Tax=Oryza sativa subsp. japonica TaxID=39947 RepID=A0A0P0XQX6_ORYSJ|nr:hypothetical protein EE612_049493 [Oryza sativa]BAT09422.1 Os09g0563275 [Oryza sativa Japonica Group]